MAESKKPEAVAADTKTLKAQFLTTVNASILKGEASKDYTGKLATLTAMIGGSYLINENPADNDAALEAAKPDFVAQKEGKFVVRENNIWNKAIKQAHEWYGIRMSDERTAIAEKKADAARVKKEKAARELLGIAEGAEPVQSVELPAELAEVVQRAIADENFMVNLIRFSNAYHNGKSATFKINREVLAAAA